MVVVEEGGERVCASKTRRVSDRKKGGGKQLRENWKHASNRECDGER